MDAVVTQLPMDATLPPHTGRRHMAAMNRSGHMTWTWDPENDERVVAAIQRMMDEGFVFWIVKRNPLREEELENVEDLQNNRHIVIHDLDLEELFREGVVNLARNDTAQLEQVRRTTDAREAAANDTVMHQPRAAG